MYIFSIPFFILNSYYYFLLYFLFLFSLLFPVSSFYLFYSFLYSNFHRSLLLYSYSPSPSPSIFYPSPSSLAITILLSSPCFVFVLFAIRHRRQTQHGIFVQFVTARSQTQPQAHLSRRAPSPANKSCHSARSNNHREQSLSPPS